MTWNVAIAIAYFVSGRFGLSFATLPSGKATALWIPSGVALSALLFGGRRLWPGIWAGSFLLNFLDFDSLSLREGAISASIATGSTIQALVCHHLILRWIGSIRILDRVADVFRFAGIASLSCCLASTFGATSICLGSAGPWSAWLALWWTWYLGDLMGIIVVTPIILTAPRLKPSWDLVLTVAAAAGLAMVVFGGWLLPKAYPMAFTMVTVFVFAAWRHGQPGVAITAGTVFCVVILETLVAGRGQFSGASQNESLLLLQWFMGVMVMTGLVLAAALEERRNAQQTLQQAHDQLELRGDELAQMVELLRQENSSRSLAQVELDRRNRDLETLLYVTSHDLREPLRSIEAFARMLSTEYAHAVEAEGRDWLARIGRASGRMQRLLDDILTLSRAQRMEPPEQVVEGGVLVQEAVDQLADSIVAAGASVRIIGSLPRFRVNPTWATRAVYNLLSNALKFSPAGAPVIEVAAYHSNGEAGISVRDRGPGVAPEHADRIFQLFQRASPREVEGTGAGLAIVRQVAERHGGRAWVSPRPDGGSEFVITFGSGQGADSR